MHAAVLLSLLSTVAPAPSDAQSDTAPVFRGGLELSALAFPSGLPPGGEDGFLHVTPLLAYDAQEHFSIELGADLRLRFVDTDPQQRAADHFGLLRREDWDELSDFGQLLRSLRAGGEGSVFQLEAGALHSHTMGNGQLISRYSNQLNPNYHPAGASAALFLGPTRTELFVSDVLGGRLFALEVAVDVARSFGANVDAHDRYHLALSAAHDFGRAGGGAPPLTLAWFEFNAALMRGEKTQLGAYLGAGGRVQDDGNSLGATLGLAGDTTPWRNARLGGRLEVRKQNSGFRQGMVGFDYELSRFSGVGLALPPIAHERLPNGFSFKAEVSSEAGAQNVRNQDRAHVLVSISAEYFTLGRADVELAAHVRSAQGRLTVGGRGALVGIGLAPRYVLALDVKYRVLPSLYVFGDTGTVHFPQPDGTLAQGLFGGLGVAADFAL